MEVLDKTRTRGRSQSTFSFSGNPDCYLNGAIFEKTLSEAAVTVH